VHLELLLGGSGEICEELAPKDGIRILYLHANQPAVGGVEIEVDCDSHFLGLPEPGFARREAKSVFDIAR
jgi:hypothetical protein